MRVPSGRAVTAGVPSAEEEARRGLNGVPVGALHLHRHARQWKVR